MNGLNDSGIDDDDEECVVMLGVFVRICVGMILISEFRLKSTWLAQMAERTTFNRVVVGSIPTSGVQKVQISIPEKVLISIPEECAQKHVPRTLISSSGWEWDDQSLMDADDDDEMLRMGIISIPYQRFSVSQAHPSSLFAFIYWFSGTFQAHTVSLFTETYHFSGTYF